MSERNGDKSRFQINRKRAVLRRVRSRELAAGLRKTQKPVAVGAPTRKGR